MLSRRNPDFAHPLLVIIRNCPVVLGTYRWTCRVPKIMSNQTSLTCGVPADEQCDLDYLPGDHEQSTWHPLGGPSYWMTVVLLMTSAT